MLHQTGESSHVAHRPRVGASFSRGDVSLQALDRPGEKLNRRGLIVNLPSKIVGDARPDRLADLMLGIDADVVLLGDSINSPPHLIIESQSCVLKRARLQLNSRR